MLKKLGLLLGLAMSLTLTSSASAAFIFGVDASIATPVDPGSSGFVTVFVNNTGAPTLVDTIVVSMNIGATGPATLGNLTLGAPTLAPGNPIDDFFSAPSASLLSVNSFPAASLSAGRTDLFRIPFTVSPATMGGAFTFDIVGVGPGGFQTKLENGGSSLSPDFSALPEFTMSVTTVPEPASLGLGALALAGVGGTVRKIRNRKKTAAA